MVWWLLVSSSCISFFFTFVLLSKLTSWTLSYCSVTILKVSSLKPSYWTGDLALSLFSARSNCCSSFHIRKDSRRKNQKEMTKQLLNSAFTPEAKAAYLEMINARRWHGETIVVACNAASREDFILRCWYSSTFN